MVYLHNLQFHMIISPNPISKANHKSNLVRKMSQTADVIHFTTLENNLPTERFHWCHAVLQHSCRIVPTDLDIQGSHAHHVHTQSSCAWSTNGEVHGETVMHNNVKRCLHKWILIAVAIETAMLEDSMTSDDNALYTGGAVTTHFTILHKWTAPLQ